jgi:hypothetical protein
LLKTLMAAIPQPSRRGRDGKESAVSGSFCEMQMPRFARHDRKAAFSTSS